MNLNLSVTKDTASAALRVASRNVAYAQAEAINAVTNDAQKAIQDSLGKNFILRRPDFIRRTIKRNRGDFATRANPVGIVRVDPERDFLAKFEANTVKTARDGSHITIPTSAVRRSKLDIVLRAQRPRAILSSRSAQSGRVFKTDRGIFKAIGQGARTALVKLYTLATRVPVPKRLHFVDTASRTVDRLWQRRANEALEKAVFSTNARAL